MEKQKDAFGDSSQKFVKALAKILEVTEEQGFFEGWDQAADLYKAINQSDFEDNVEHLLSYALRKLQEQNPHVTNKEVLLSFPIRELIRILETKLDYKFNLNLQKEEENEG